MSATPIRAVQRAAAVALAGLDQPAGDEVRRCLAVRGLPSVTDCPLDQLDGALDDGAVIGVWLDATASAAAGLLDTCRAAAQRDRPVVALVRAARPRPVEAAAAVAALRAQGAVVCGDPDTWIEALCLVAWHGVPAGPRTAVVAAPGSWLAAAAASLEGDADGRRPAVVASADDAAPVDVALVAGGNWTEVRGRRGATALVVPVVARAELADDAPAGALHGLRPALAAVAAAGLAATRTRAGLGPAGRTGRGELEVDEERLARQLGKLTAGDVRLGDHETKVLLSAYGVAITRQAVATTASAAVRVAKKAGFPVDVKPWGPDVAAEPDAPVERNLTTAADVRRAYATVLGHGARPAGAGDEGAVIVRATPRSGRELAATIAPLGPLGWTVVVEVAGQPPAAAPAPLRVADASALAHLLVASRAGEDEPDRVALANLLRRASHLAVDHADRLARLTLHRIVVGGRGAGEHGDATLVVDASAELVAPGG